MIRIQRNKYGEETKSAMICFKREEDAASALEQMERNDEWEVTLYSPKERRQYPREQRNYRRNDIYNTDIKQKFNEGSKYKKAPNHWSLTKPSFFDKKEYYDHFPKLAKEDQDLKGEVQLLKDQMQIMSKSINTVLTYMEGSRMRFPGASEPPTLKSATISWRSRDRT